MDNWTRLISSGFGDSACPEGAHILHLYGDEAERRRELSGFIELGHAASDRVLYIADTIIEDADEWTEVSGIGEDLIDAYSKAEILRACDVYYASGTFDPDPVLERLTALYLESVEAGHRGLRVTGEMTWALSDVQGAERLAEYEKGVNDVVAAYPLTAVCQYDLNRFSADLLKEVLRSHPFIVENGQVIPNLHFEE